jgi:O-antigen ligase
MKLTGIPYCYLHVRTSAQKLLAITRRQDALLNFNLKDTEIWENSLKKWKDSSVTSYGPNTVKERYYEITQHYQDSETVKARRDVLRIKET